MKQTEVSSLLRRGLGALQTGNLGDAEHCYRSVLDADPANFDALHLLGIVNAQLGRNEEAAKLLAAAVRQRPRAPEALSNLGTVLIGLGRYQEALERCNQALKNNAHDTAAFSNRGNALCQLGRYEEAVASYDRALAIGPANAATLNNRGSALRELKRYDEALASCDQALSIAPRFPQALSNRGKVLNDLGRFEEALGSLEKALELNPDYADAFNNRGIILQSLGRNEDAVASYDRALSIAPRFVQALANRGKALNDLGRFEEALRSLEKALELNPDHADASNNRGVALQALGRHEEALASYSRATEIRPDFVEAWINRGGAFFRLHRPHEAVDSYRQALARRPDDLVALANLGRVLALSDGFEAATVSCDKALAIKPDYADAHFIRGYAVAKLGRPLEALDCYDRALELDQTNGEIYSVLALACLRVCEWRRVFAAMDGFRNRLEKANPPVHPFVGLLLSEDPADHLACASRYVGRRPAVNARVNPVSDRRQIRLAYLSADFRDHPVAYAIPELLESHDRSRFDVIGISYGPDDGSDIRARIARGCDRFYDVSSQGDGRVANLLRSLEVDIAVDLTGFTDHARPEILAWRPAPVQVNYLGYSSTMGADFIDYVIGDEVVLPFSEQAFFTEKIIHLPDCFLPNDGKRTNDGEPPTRVEAGLPETGFVFCSFNGSSKIRPAVFDIWMQLLRNVGGSVLWLAQTDELATVNLRREAQTRGVDPSRLVFASKVRSRKEHLARHRLADVFLDTLPYNAHSTAVDALGVGLPVLTVKGCTFAGRVAASALRAIGLRELATGSLAEYEQLAMQLAIDPSALQTVRNKLAANRATHPLFDSNRYRRHIEAAYLEIWEIWRRGESPRSFSVDATC